MSSMQDGGLWHLVLRQSSLFTRAERKRLKDRRKRWSASYRQETAKQNGDERIRTAIIQEEGKQRKEVVSGVRFLSRVTGGFALRYRERSSALRRTVVFEP